MYLSLNNTGGQNIVVNATDGRGTLTSAVITLVSVVDELRTVELTKSNISAYQDRYDEFTIDLADYSSMPEGEFIYTIKAAAGGDIDETIILERGRGRIAEAGSAAVEKEHTNLQEAKIYEHG